MSSSKAVDTALMERMRAYRGIRAKRKAILRRARVGGAAHHLPFMQRLPGATTFHFGGETRFVLGYGQEFPCCGCGLAENMVNKD
jgi:hypothetical protein